MIIRYIGNGQECYVKCTDEVFLKKIKHLFNGFEITHFYDNDFSSDNTIQISYIKGGKYSILYGEVNEIFHIEWALGYVVRTILNILGKEVGQKSFLHGGCVQYCDKYNCFLGKTKSGKSTLTYLLCLEPDCRYVTDDLIFINKTLECIPFLKPIFLRDSKYIQDFNDITTIRYQNEYRYCILPDHKVDKNMLHKIDNIFIVERNPIEDFSVERLSVSAAFINIWKNMHTSDFIYDKRNTALKLAKATKVFKLNYRDVSFDLKSILECME